MPNKTTNYGLKKPLPEEFYDVGVQNENMDIIDDELEKRIPQLAKYYSPQTDGGKSADDLLDPFALIPVSSEVNTELYDIVGGTFAWVWTSFYIKVDVTSRRMQVAMSYNTVNHKMAYRIYGANGWLEWKGLATDDEATNIPVSSAVPADSDIWIDPDDENEIITPEKIGAAPSGYGYGEIPVNLGSTTDDATFLVKLNEQFSKTVSRTRMVTFIRNGNGWIGTLWNAGNGYGSLTAYCYNGDNSSQFAKLIRNCRNGTWQDWEFENPPLKNNTEYLTTERYDGKPVYVKRVDLGALPNTSNKREVIVPTGVTIISIDGYSVYTSEAGNEIYTPLVKTEGITSFFVNKTTGQVGVNTDTDLSTYTATVTVKYTK